MMNPSAILQMPTGAASARTAGRQTSTDGNGGGFADLLAKFKATVEAGSDETATTPPDEDQASKGERLLDLLKGGSDSPNPQGGLSSEGLAGLMQALGGAATANDVAALLARSGGADAHVREPAVLAGLTKLSNPDGAPIEEGEALAAVLTVLGRETHLAPAQTAAASSVHSQWAAEAAQQARHAAQAAANGKPGDVTPTASGQRTGQPNGSVELSVTGLAVTAAQDARFGDPEGEGSPSMDGRSTAEALITSQVSSAAGTGDVLPTGSATVSVAQQIADQVVGEARALTSAGRPDIPTFARHQLPMKVLYIQLQPADLGTVTIRMSVTDNTLRLELEAGRGETVRLIQRDQDALSGMLRSAGYLIDGMEVRLADQVSAGSQSSMGQANSQPQGGQSGSPQQDTRSWGERHSREQPHNPFSQRGHGDDEQAGRSASRGGVYI